ncbi:MAG TPA: hypothetical protein VGQ05_06330 [Streptosporangiaceae bacterium]|nr:hypothetical protein [Streptosporangiaceae bacterium]
MTGADAMTRPAAANGAARTPRDFAVLLPPGWVRIKLDGSEPVVLARLVAAKVATVDPAQREEARALLTRTLGSALRDARAAGGLDVLLSVAESHGVPIAASCLITYLDKDGDKVPLDGLLMDLSARGGQVTGTEIANGPAIRHQYEVSPPEGSQSEGRLPEDVPAGAEPVATRVTMVDYFLPLPGRPGLLVLSFSTPVEPLAEALVMLFDAIAESLRWTR